MFCFKQGAIMEEQNIEQVSYNLSEAKIKLIAKKLYEADYYYSSGNFRKAFFCIKSIRLIIGNRLKPKELKRCKELEYAPFKNKDEKNLAFYFEVYYSKVNELLKIYGFDIREKEESMF